MGHCCSGICRGCLIFWGIITVLFSLGLIGLMSYRITNHTIYPETPLLEVISSTQWFKISFSKFINYTLDAMLALACLELLVGIIAVVSTFRHAGRLLGLMLFFAVIIVCADVAGLSIYFVSISQIKESLPSQLNITIADLYGKDMDITNSWNNISSAYDCCGIYGPDDFKIASHWNRTMSNIRPCRNETNDTTAFGVKGCLASLEDLISINSSYLLALACTGGALALILLLHGSCVCKHRSSKSDNSGNEESFTLTRR